MKFQLLAVVLMLASWLWVGCGESGSRNQGARDDDDDRAVASAHLTNAVTFSEKKGLHIPAAAAQFIGLKVEDVSERNVSGGTSFEAQVYSANPNSLTLASGMVPASLTTPIQTAGRIEVLSSTGAAFQAQVIEVKPHWAGHTEVLLSISDPKRVLKPGSVLSARPSRNGAQAKAVAVPNSALLRTLEGSFVYTVSGGHYVRTAVVVGETNGEFVEIKDGLYAGDQVVTQPAMSLWLAELQAIRGGKACADGD